MSIRNQNWYNLQATRRYPLDDTSTGVDDAGAFIRDDILVDCHLRFPETLGRYAYVQGITVSANLVTVILGVTDNVLNPAGVTVAAVSLVKPVDVNVNYAVTPLVAGVSGWMTFGPGIETDFVGRYSLPSQSFLLPRCARPYRALPISSCGKLGLPTALQGLVNITASAPLKATYVADAGNVIDGFTKTVVGTATNAIVFEIDQNAATATYNPLQEFLGPCAQRPESGTCPKTPIETINGVLPDCNGNIVIEFLGFDARPFENCGGIDVLTDLSLAETCLAPVVDPRREFNDICCDPEVNPNPDPYCWPDPTTALDAIVEELVPLDFAQSSLPVCVDMNGCYTPNEFIEKTGAFLSEQTLAPPLCGADPNAFVLTNHYTYAAASNSNNVALFKNAATDWALNRQFSTQLKISGQGAQRNGGLVFNYRQELVDARIVTTYVVVIVDVAAAAVRVLRYNNGTFVEEHTVNFAARTGTWYRLSAAPVRSGTAVLLSFAVTNMTNTSDTATGAVTIAQYGDPTGFTGLFSRQSFTYFNTFRVD
jgi:hypothetical protein